MEKFRQFLFSLGLSKGVALLSVVCLLLQSAIFYLGVFLCLTTLKPNSLAMFGEARNGATHFIFFVVPLILFFSGTVSFMAVFSMIAANNYRRIISSALLVGITQSAPLLITIPLFALLAFWGWHYLIAAAPIYLLIIIPVIIGSRSIYKSIETIS